MSNVGVIGLGDLILASAPPINWPAALVAMWMTAVRYAFNKTLELALNNSQSRRPSSTLDEYPTVVSADRQSDDAAFYGSHVRQASFKPQYAVPIRRPRTDAEAQRLYNHIRTVAWYLDSLPLCSTFLPFNIGVESIVGFIPVVGDYVGLVLGVYVVYLCSLFGLPIRVLFFMLVNVVLDCFVGLVPIVGDLLDVAFKSNLRNLQYLEDHLSSSKGRCGAGTYYIYFPPADSYMPRRHGSFPSHTQQDFVDMVGSKSSQRESQSVFGAKNQPRSRERLRADFMNLPASITADMATSYSCMDRGSQEGGESEAYTIPDEAISDSLSPPSEVAHAREDTSLRKERTQSCDADPHAAIHEPHTSTTNSSQALEVPQSSSDCQMDRSNGIGARPLFNASDSRPRVSWHEEPSHSIMDHQRTDSLGKGPNLDLERNFEHPRDLWRRRRNMYLVVYSAIFCVAYITSLDSNTAYLYLNFACSEYGALASFSTVAIVQQMIYAVAKPPIAKLSDVFGRPQAYGLSLIFYVCGYLIVASSTSLRSMIGGICLQSVGNTGVQVLQSIIIADTTTAKWRGLVIGIVNLPFLINFAVAGPLVDVVMRHGGWRSGFAIWTLLVPLSALPLLITLAVGQRRAQRAGLTVKSPLAGQTRKAALRQLAVELDILGLVLFTGGWLLILLPLTLAGHGERPAGVPMTTFILGGSTLLLLFVWWEMKATVPILPYQFLSNKAVVCTCIVGVLDFASFYISWTFLSSFIQILKGWDQTKTGYFATTQNVTSTITGIVVGSLMAMTRRYKTLLMGGLIVRLIGATLMIRFRTAEDPTYMLVLCQLLQGVGGGSIAITMQVAVQVTVRHADVAIVTALELLTTEIGAAIGSATAGWVFQTHLPAKLAMGLPDMDPDELKQIYGSLQKALSYPIGSAERGAIMHAWVEVMRILSITATLVLLPAVLIGLAIPDASLPDVHGVHHGTYGKGDRRSRRRRSSFLAGDRPSSTSGVRTGLFDTAVGSGNTVVPNSVSGSHRDRSVSKNRYSASTTSNPSARRLRSRERLAS